MYLEEKIRTMRMQKGECIDPFLLKLENVRDSMEVVGSTPQPTKMARLALNLVSKEWQVFVH